MIALTAFVGEIRKIKVTLNAPPTTLRAIVSYPGTTKTTTHMYPSAAWELVSPTVYCLLIACTKPGDIIGGIEATSPVQYDEFLVKVSPRRFG